MFEKKWTRYLGAICILTGLLLAWLFNMRSVISSASAVPGRNGDLVNIIKATEKETAALGEEIVVLRAGIDTLQKNGAGDDSLVTSLREKLSYNKALAGLTEVSGPGIVISMDDNEAGAKAAKKSNPSTYNPERFIIHDKNVLYLVNELKRNGAEAIAINGQRIILSSDIRCVGTVILVNSTRLAPPYEIRAIGDPEGLEKAILGGEEFPYLKFQEYPVKLVKSEEVKIPPYKGSYTLTNSRLATEKSEGRKK